MRGEAMLPMEEEEELQGGADADALDLQNLDEMMEFAQAGMSKDMLGRAGKALPEEEAVLGAEDELPPEDPEIPGVEAEPMGEEASAGMDMDALRAVLAKLKGAG